MRNFLYRFSMFMQGRYGNDELNIFLLVLSVIISVISRFIWNYWVRLILHAVSLLLFGLVIFRTLSRNIPARAKENRLFAPTFHKVIDWFKFTFMRLRDGRTHRYYKCPKCKAKLRVKNVKGKHTIRCPKCGNTFEKTIR